MKWLLFVFFTLLLILSFPFARAGVTNQKTRTISIGETDVSPIRTAMGYSTILQFDAKPTAAVLGDQDAFRVEYVGQSLTVKPLIRSAATNLFVFTDYDRYNFKLVTVGADTVDYIVKIQRKSKATQNDRLSFGASAPENSEGEIPSDEKITTKAIGRQSRCGSLTFKVNSVSVGSTKKWVSISFLISIDPKAIRKSLQRFEPGDFAVVQEEKSLPIESLFFDGLVFSKTLGKIKGVAVLDRAQIKSGKIVLVRFSADFIKPGCAFIQVKLSSQEILNPPRK